jgi:hypothetical protein
LWRPSDYGFQEKEADFLELKHDAFRRIILRLKRKGKIIATHNEPFQDSTFYLNDYLRTLPIEKQFSKTNVSKIR